MKVEEKNPARLTINDSGEESMAYIFQSGWFIRCYTRNETSFHDETNLQLIKIKLVFWLHDFLECWMSQHVFWISKTSVKCALFLKLVWCLVTDHFLWTNPRNQCSIENKFGNHWLREGWWIYDDPEFNPNPTGMIVELWGSYLLHICFPSR